MAVPFDLIRLATVEGALQHPPDFVYKKSPNDLAAKIQRLINDADLPLAVEVDKDQDIVVSDPSSREDLILVLEKQIGFQLKNIPVKGIKGARHALRRRAKLIEDLFALRDLPTRELSGLQITLALPFKETVAGDILAKEYFAPLLGRLTGFDKGIVRSGQLSAVRLTDGAYHYSLAITAQKDSRALLVNYEGHIHQEEQQDLTYPKFVDHMLAVFQSAMPKFVAPILASKSLDSGFLEKGERTILD